MKKTKKNRKRKIRGGTKSVAAKKVFNDPFLSKYISEFNLIPGKKYKIFDPLAEEYGMPTEFTFIKEFNDKYGLYYVFEQIDSNGELHQIIYKTSGNIWRSAKISNIY